ncbi:MAG: hypothetical protein ACXWUG_08580 [Polyangiales bacterium]
MLAEAISRTAWDLLRALEDLSAESGALVRELDEAWGVPVDAADIVTLYPGEDRPTLPA